MELGFCRFALLRFMLKFVDVHDGIRDSRMLDHCSIPVRDKYSEAGISPGWDLVSGGISSSGIS